MNVKCPKPGCGTVMTCDDQMAGQKVQCSGCGHAFTVPPRVDAVAPAVPPGGAAGTPVTPAAPAPAPPEKLQKQAVAAVVQGVIAIVVCVVLQQFVVDLLPGTDVRLGRSTTIALWIKAGLAVAILVLMLRLLSPLRSLSSYYIGLIFRVSSALATEWQLQSQVSSVGLYAVLIAYIAVLYQAVIPWVLGFINALAGKEATGNLDKIVKLAFALIGTVVIIKLILAARPLAARLTKSITDRTVALTEKVDSKVCGSCGARVDRAVRFCPSCGKES